MSDPVAGKPISAVTALGSLLFLILAPGMIAGYIPLALLRWGAQINTGVLAYLAFPLWLIGGSMILWSFWNFLRQGRGTPAPVAPPTELVAVGFYRYVRNPMYVGVMAMILGYYLWFGYWNLLIYSALVFLAFHTFVTLYEEPKLKRTFGAAYEDYCRRVPRWIPRIPK
jgi:protein-S-isoprenylcysteine O-methyltransferase Ste14